MRLVDWALRVTPAALLLTLVGVFVRRKFYRDFPFFFAYIVFAPLATAARVSVSTNPWRYAVVYWSTEAIFGILALMALNEVFKRMFDLDYDEHWWFRLILPVTAIVISCFFLTQPLRPTVAARITNAIFSFDLGVHCLEGILLAIFLPLQIARVPVSDQYESGILAGFGVSAAITMVADVIRSDYGKTAEAFFRYAPPVGYIIAAGIWLHAFLKAPPPHQQLPVRISELIQLLKKQREIAELIAKKWRFWRYEA